MTAGLVRYQQTGDLHAVNFSCYQRRQHLANAFARALFERSLETMRLRYDFRVTAYVAMPDHVHLLLSEPRVAPLAIALQALKLSVARQSPAKPFWQKRYFDLNLWSERKIAEKRDYMHWNPVAAGLVKKAEDWPWSSCRAWSLGEVGKVEVECPATARRRGGLGMRLGADGRAVETHVSEARRGPPGSGVV